MKNENYEPSWCFNHNIIKWKGLTACLNPEQLEILATHHDWIVDDKVFQKAKKHALRAKKYLNGDLPEMEDWFNAWHQLMLNRDPNEIDPSDEWLQEKKALMKMVGKCWDADDPEYALEELKIKFIRPLLLPSIHEGLILEFRKRLDVYNLIMDNIEDYSLT